jgi:hypothetical protein
MNYDMGLNVFISVGKVTLKVNYISQYILIRVVLKLV